jgi:small-conductance mechanosensitive channel
MFLGSIITSTILQHRYESMKDSSADRGVSFLLIASSFFRAHFFTQHDHLSSIYSSRYRFSLTSLAFALPKTLYLWGIVTVVSTCIFWLTTALAHVCGLFAAGSVALFLVVGIFAVHRLTSESSILPDWPFRRIALNNTDNSPV